MLWRLIVLWLLSPTMLFAQVEPTCLRVDWDYTSTPRLGSFFIYTSRESGQYPIKKGKPMESRPVAILDVQPQMVTELSCSALRITQPGLWYAVVTAVSVDMLEESEPSNEITITIKAETVAPPPPPVLAPPKPPAVVTLPPPLERPGRPVATLPPLPTAPGSALTDTDVWRGTGAAPRAPASHQRSRMTDTCVWQGRACP